MAKINILSEEICNRIAAGEVIERPYSAVKEMVENSLDAGATEIEIYIERGGKDMIKIVDNGCGIDKEDMRAAFFAHATSKISTIDDIDKITTLGFRGEALATIAAIAQVELISVTEGNEANKVECDGEFIGKVQPAALEKGTQITVRNIFFNTPARQKFMKTDKKEEADITNFVSRYILGNPNVSFKYYIDGKLSMQSYGGGLEEAIAQVYGANVLPQCYKIQADRNDIKINGFIGNQNFFKPNKTYQSVFLNGRYIINQVIAGAITNAYSAYMMKRQYPFYVLFIDVPMDTVDVNVHPNKADVRFVDNTVVYGSIYKVISSILDGTAKAADFVVDTSVVPQIKSTFGENKNKVYAAEFKQEEKIYDKNFDDVKNMPDFSKDKKVEKQPTPEELERYRVYEELSKVDVNYDPLTQENIVDYFDARKNHKMLMTACNGGDFRKKEDGQGFEACNQAVELPSKRKQEEVYSANFEYKGTLFNTYLLYEDGDDVYMIDQHAAHERMIFDRLCKQMHDRKVPRQGMLIPFILYLNNKEFEYIEENIPMIRQMGFDIEPFGDRAFRVDEVPLDLAEIDLQAFFDELLANIEDLKKLNVEDVIRDKIAQMACKHAIKGGHILTELERQKLIEMIDGDFGLKCPHGRPICVKLTKSAIEKMFKRIV
jgi:DNA mismatch repair protein MutL